MRKLLKRWYVWLGLVLLVGPAGTLVWSCRSRINQDSFDQIREGMTREEVIAILGEYPGGGLGDLGIFEEKWHYGADYIAVAFIMPMDDLAVGGQRIHVEGRTVIGKTLHLATLWETLTWYAKKGAAKIGVKWD